MRKAITEISIRSLSEGIHWCARTPGFGVRVGKRRRTFIALVGRDSRVKIGLWPSLSLSDARSRAKALTVKGVQETRSSGYADAVERYLKHMEGELRRRTVYEYGLLLRRFKFPTTAVSPGEVALALDGIEKQSAKLHAFVVLGAFFKWAVQHECCEVSPMAKVRRPKVASSRERVLEDHELKAIWNACEGLGKYGALVRLCMVTGQRKGQFAALKEEWVDWPGKRFIWPASAMKTNKIHVLPFSSLAEFVLRGVTPNGGYYFSPVSALGQPFTAWSKNKAKLDALVDLDPWTLHDLRRTWSTNAARLDVPPHITERVLSHVAPEGKVAGIYNRHRYEKEMRDAMERMSTFVMGLIAE